MKWIMWNIYIKDKQNNHNKIIMETLVLQWLIYMGINILKKILNGQNKPKVIDNTQLRKLTDTKKKSSH